LQSLSLKNASPNPHNSYHHLRSSVMRPGDLDVTVGSVKRCSACSAAGWAGPEAAHFARLGCLNPTCPLCGETFTALAISLANAEHSDNVISTPTSIAPRHTWGLRVATRLWGSFSHPAHPLENNFLLSHELSVEWWCLRVVKFVEMEVWRCRILAARY
jgi:hypothetical protein